MKKLIVPVLTSIALLLAGFGHAVAAHHAVPSTAQHVSVSVEDHGAHDCEKPCPTTEQFSCCDSLVSSCAGVFIAQDLQFEAVAMAFVASYFNDDRLVVAARRIHFDPPPPKV